MESEIVKLKLKRTELEVQLSQVRNKIEDLVSKEIVPGLKKKYEGKFFKYRTNYSCPETEKDYWNIYIRVDKVLNDNHCEIFRFETDRDGKVEFQKKDRFSLSMCYTKITKCEFETAYRKTIKSIQI